MTSGNRHVPAGVRICFFFAGSRRDLVVARDEGDRAFLVVPNMVGRRCKPASRLDRRLCGWVVFVPDGMAEVSIFKRGCFGHCKTAPVISLTLGEVGFDAC